MGDLDINRPPGALRRALGRAAERPVRGGLWRLGYHVVSRFEPPGPPPIPRDCDEFTAALIERVAPYTLTTHERIIALVDAVRHVVRAEVPGALIECGVWRGGSAMVIAYTLKDLGITDREIHLYDTFTHMPEPREHDRDLTGIEAADAYATAIEMEEFSFLTLAEVKELLYDTGYPADRFHFVQGMVEETIPEQAPERIALCRLDTDWYESTAHELEHLWPRLAPGGILIVDDYGHFLGAKKAVDEYFAERPPVLLHRIDFSARLAVKSG